MARSGGEGDRRPSETRRRMLGRLGLLGLASVAGCASRGTEEPGGTPDWESTAGDRVQTTNHDSNASCGSGTDATVRGRGSYPVELSAPGLVPGEEFGDAVALEGDVALIGASSGWPGKPSADQPGSAYVFGRTDGRWHLEATLTATDGLGDTQFGDAVALSADGETAVVGAWGDDNGKGDQAGAAYAFERSGGGWEQTAKLTAADGDDADRIGDAVAIDGDIAFVGAGEDGNSNGDDAGAVYVFDRGWDWQHISKLTAADGDRKDLFGYDIAAEGGLALISAPNDDGPNETEIGSVYVFERGPDKTWSEAAKLTPSDGDRGDGFGKSIALDGTTAVVGAWLDDDPNGNKAGSAYVFGRSDGEWVREAKLAPDRGREFDHFGRAVTVDGDTAMFGVINDGENYSAVYVFERSGEGWEQVERRVPDGVATHDWFGDSVALDHPIGLAGAPNGEVGDCKDVGSAFLLSVAENG